MRVVSGKYKGRRISPPKNLPIRPTTDFAKEGLFNVLRSRVELVNSSVLDLFCGSGGMSLEFVSRGAKEVLAIDQNKSCLAFIEKTSRDWDIKEISTRRGDALKLLKNDSKPYDLIFADPPYAFKEYNELISSIVNGNKLEPSAFFILEHGKEQDFSDHPNFKFSKRFGNVNFTFFSEESE